MKNRFLIGSRSSDLALWQANFVKTRLEDFFPDSVFEIRVISTTGDQFVDVALSKIGDKGLFTRQIETQLLSGEIDFAVHSLKDLQTDQPDGLRIGAVCKRELPNDVLISKEFSSIDGLPKGAKVATGSLRRKSQLLTYRPDLEIVEIRGNVPTRLKKFDESGVDAMILAYAGLHRLGFDSRVSQLIAFNVMLPAVGQGAIAVEIRGGDAEIAELVVSLEDGPTRTCIIAERAFLRTLEGGCQVPIGAYASLENGQVYLEGMVGSLDGTIVFRESIHGDAGQSERLGIRLAEKLIQMGASELLAQVRAEASAEAVIR